MIIDKTFVKKQFNSRLNTYSAQAVVQKSIALKLVWLLNELQLNQFSKVFEVGCGTGFLTVQLLKKLAIDQLIVNDITNSVQEKISEIAEHYKINIPFLFGDAEETAFPQNLNAVFSTSTIQWFKHLERFFTKVNNYLNSKGIFAFSTFGPDNFIEISDLTGVSLEYHSLNKLCTMLPNEFEILSAQEWVEKMEFKHPINVLRHIKQTGVNAIRKVFFGKEYFQKFTENYCKRFTTSSNTVTLTYHPIIIIAQKK